MTRQTRVLRYLWAMFLRLTTAFSLLAAPLAADPVRYDLQPELSTVGFSYTLAGQRTNGRMPVASANIMLDLDRPERSQVTAIIDAAGADAGPWYADDAMRSAEVLDTRSHPQIRFESTSITGDLSGGTVEGLITIRGVTRPITLDARFYRQSGTERTDRSRLQIVLRGEISRQSFGAAGFGGLVGDKISLTILTRIRRAG